jgi:hypothetical protein
MYKIQSQRRAKPPASDFGLWTFNLLRIGAWCLVFSILASARAATLSDPAVDRYNMRIGTQTFSGLYKFTTNTLLVATAEALTNMRSDTLRMEISSGY